MAAEVRNRRRGASRVSAKHQVTIPVDAMRAAGITEGDRLVARAIGPGQLVLEREVEPVEEFAGALTGVFDEDDLDRLRGEWD